MAVPTAPNNTAPVTDTAAGVRHQIVKPPAASASGPAPPANSGYTA
jgi:hypothetical protein